MLSGLNLALLETPEDRFSRAEAQLREREREREIVASKQYCNNKTTTR